MEDHVFQLQYLMNPKTIPWKQNFSVMSNESESKNVVGGGFQN